LRVSDIEIHSKDLPFVQGVAHFKKSPLVDCRFIRTPSDNHALRDGVVVDLLERYGVSF
jgi:hypothetical protein